MEKLHESDLLFEIYQVLHRLGMTSNYTGYFQMAYAVYLVVRSPQRLLHVTKWLYPEVAQQFHTTRFAVERNIRFAIGVIRKANTPLLAQLTGGAETLTNAQFLSILAAYFLPNYAA